MHEHWVWFGLSNQHICHWLNAYLSLIAPKRVQIIKRLEAFVSLTKCIIVIDHWVWFRLNNQHNCHWLNAYLSLITECDLHSETCIFVIDQMHICHWPLILMAAEHNLSSGSSAEPSFYFLKSPYCVFHLDLWSGLFNLYLYCQFCCNFIGSQDE